jgi:hypothetical protein
MVTPLDAYSSIILSVVYTHQDLCKTNTYCKASSYFLQQDKDYRILATSIPFSLLDTIKKMQMSLKFHCWEFSEFTPHYSYRKWHTITLDTIKELLGNIIYCTWDLFLVYE